MAIEREILLAQWQTCVEMANSVSNRRDNMNNIFVTLNLAIIATFSIIGELKSLFLLISGIVECVIWMFFIRNFKLLNTEKFVVINNIEKKLPVQPFTDEWKKLKKNKKYRDSTNLEMMLPIMFVILYVVGIISTIIIQYCNVGG